MGCLGCKRFEPEHDICLEDGALEYPQSGERNNRCGRPLGHGSVGRWPARPNISETRSSRVLHAPNGSSASGLPDTAGHAPLARAELANNHGTVACPAARAQVWGPDAEKDTLFVDLLPRLLKISQQRFTDILRQGSLADRRPLRLRRRCSGAAHLTSAMQKPEVAGALSEPHQRENDRPIANANRRGRIRRQ